MHKRWALSYSTSKMVDSWMTGKILVGMRSLTIRLASQRFVSMRAG